MGGAGGDCVLAGGECLHTTGCKCEKWIASYNDFINKIIAATFLGKPQPEEKTSITRHYGVDLPGFKPIVKFA